MKKYKILHITPHLGGGVGRVVLSYFSKVKEDPAFLHKLICLDYANDNAIEVAEKNNILLFDKMSFKMQKILVAESDIVLIHWWNHPLLYDFLVRQQLSPCRIIIWSHNSGFYPPGVFTEKIIEYPDLFVFSTPESFKSQDIQKLSIDQKKSLRVVWSTAGIEHIKNIKPESHNDFTIGYIGTVDYCKIHFDFLSICNQIGNRIDRIYWTKPDFSFSRKWQSNNCYISMY